MNLLAYMQKRCYFCSQNESGADGRDTTVFTGFYSSVEKKTQGKKSGGFNPPEIDKEKRECGRRV
jgi:hypothetical protein